MYSIEWRENKVDLSLSVPELTGFAIAGYSNYGPELKISQESKHLNIQGLITGNIILAPTGGPFLADYNPNISWRSNMVGIFGACTE